MIALSYASGAAKPRLEFPEYSFVSEANLLKQLHGIDEGLCHTRKKRDACNAPGQNETQSTRIALNMFHLSLPCSSKLLDFKLPVDAEAQCRPADKRQNPTISLDIDITF